MRHASLRLPALLLSAAVWPALACAYLPTAWLEEPPETPPPLVSQPASQLPAPEGLRATSGEYRAIPLQWDPILSGDVGGYRIERADAQEGPYLPLVAIWSRGVTARADPTLGDDVTRFYRIRAFTRDGRLSEHVSEVVVGTTAPLPAAPEGLRAYSRQPRQVPLSWHASEDERVVGYVVERSPAPDGPFEVIAAPEGRYATAYVDEDLGDLRVFHYRVAARNTGGAAGAPSETVRAVTKPEPLPPLDLQLESQRLGVNELTWEPNVERDIDAYRLYRILPDAPAQLVASVPGDRTHAADANVDAAERVVYAVVAVDRDGLESRPSVPLETEGVDYDLHAEAHGDGVHLRWDPRPREGFVRARVERDGWLGWRAVGTSETGDLVDADVEPGNRYRYVAVLQRPDDSEAPASRPVAVQIPEAGDFR